VDSHAVDHQVATLTPPEPVFLEKADSHFTRFREDAWHARNRPL
jgi:hypothetical protein